METWDVCEAMIISADNETCLYREEIDDLPQNWILCRHPNNFNLDYECENDICPIKKENQRVPRQEKYDILWEAAIDQQEICRKCPHFQLYHTLDALGENKENKENGNMEYL